MVNTLKLMWSNKDTFYHHEWGVHEVRIFTSYVEMHVQHLFILV